MWICIIYIKNRLIVINKFIISPTRNTNTIVEPDSSTAPNSDIEAAEAPYVFRCRECESYT